MGRVVHEVVVWALKPAEEGMDQGVIVRVWNHADAPVAQMTLTFHGGLASARKTTHPELFTL
jgi:alpha-mannosidase